MEITKYRSGMDMDVKWETGSTTRGVSYHNFCNDMVRNYDVPFGMNKQDYIKYFINGINNNNGWNMKVFKYRSCTDLDVIFEENNAVVHCKDFSLFKNGNIEHPNREQITPEEYHKRMNMVVYKNNGHYCQILNYRSAGDIDVYFDGDKTKVAYHKIFSCFKFGKVGCPDDLWSIKPIDNVILRKIKDQYIRGAKRRKILWNLSDKDLLCMINKPCYYCGKKGSNSIKIRNKQYYYNGIDRKNNNIGYELANCVPCCSICNRGKNSATFDEWTNYLNNLVKFRVDNNLYAI